MKTKSKKALPKMLTGSVVMQMVRCGKVTCKCAQGELHGPYFYRFYRVGGRLRKQYVKQNELNETILACSRFKLYREKARQEARLFNEQFRAYQASYRDLCKAIYRSL